METVLSILRKSEAFLAKKGLEKPRLDAELLLANSLGLRRLDLYLNTERLVDETTLNRLRAELIRRGNREPLQYIIGYAHFGDSKLQVDPSVLIPRPETEFLCEELVAHYAKQSSPSTIADLGTGSGAIAIYLAKAWPNSTVYAVDQSQAALAIAQRNIAKNELSARIHTYTSNWLSALTESFDLIVANPPYLTETEWQSAQPEVKLHEPKSALTAPQDGLSDLIHILEAAKQHLKAGGLLALEMGIHHAEALSSAAYKLGYSTVHTQKDLTHRDRFVWCWV